MISLISRILKNDTNGFIYKTETDSVLEEELMVSKVGRLWGGTDWEFGIDLNTLLYLKSKTNKDLLYTTGHSGPTVYHKECCSIFCNNLKGKEFEKRIDTRIRITESACYTPETNTLLINYTSI